jgi:hypothetical protein
MNVVQQNQKQTQKTLQESSSSTCHMLREISAQIVMKLYQQTGQAGGVVVHWIALPVIWVLVASTEVGFTSFWCYFFIRKDCKYD